MSDSGKGWQPRDSKPECLREKAKNVKKKEIPQKRAEIKNQVVMINCGKCGGDN
eukprot:c26742_g1_i1 orf=599-760(+)